MEPEPQGRVSPLKRAPWAGGLLLWCWVVYHLSAQSDPTEAVDWALAVPDWLAHGIEYAAGGFLAWGTFRGRRPLASWGLALGFVLARGVLDEWHQSFVPGRSPEVADVLADLVGGFAGTLAHAAWDRRAGRSTESEADRGDSR